MNSINKLAAIYKLYVESKQQDEDSGRRKEDW